MHLFTNPLISVSFLPVTLLLRQSYKTCAHIKRHCCISSKRRHLRDQIDTFFTYTNISLLSVPLCILGRDFFQFWLEAFICSQLLLLFFFLGLLFLYISVSSFLVDQRFEVFRKRHSSKSSSKYILLLYCSKSKINQSKYFVFW